MKLSPGVVFNGILVGIVGGCLILIGMLMFNAVLGLLFTTGSWTMLGILCFTSLVVGMLARLMQPFHGLVSAAASGVVAALLILYLWLSSESAAPSSLVFGPAGMLVAIVFSLLGAWVLPFLRKRKLPVK